MNQKGQDLGYHISPVKKQKRNIKMSVGRDDKRKKFHILFVAEGIEIPLPPELERQVKEMGFDFSCGIKASTLEEAYEETKRLLAQGYTEEEAPCGI